MSETPIWLFTWQVALRCEFELLISGIEILINQSFCFPFIPEISISFY